MKYCFSCGQQLQQDLKFCPACGAAINKTSAGNEGIKMHKRQSKSLKSQISNNVKEKAQNYLKDQAKSAFENSNNSFKDKEDLSSEFTKKNSTLKTQSSIQEAKTNKLGFWTLIYLGASILLALAKPSDEKIGLLFFTVIILLFALIRYKKSKPYNLALKIIIVVQMVFTVALLAAFLESGYGNLPMINLALMLFAQIMLLFKGNN
jgi:cation transport ATPase